MPEHQILPEQRMETAADNGVHANGVGSNGVNGVPINGGATNGVAPHGIEIKPCAEDHVHRNGTTAPAAPEPATTAKTHEREVEPNYQYWRDNGGEWADGYDYRKKRQVLYHIQELMLTQYIQQHAATAATKPIKVLEFGCGVGRHLRNLTRLPDVDAYGHDQSRTMAANILRWAGRQWFDSHINVGMPTGPLPYPDKHFDIVYSAEVLIHVRPEHLDGILRELVRVCRGHILHLENSEHHRLISDAHDGCWMHDMVAAYARLGLECEVLSSGYFAHTPYRVALGEEPRFTWAPAILEMYRRLERDMDEGFEAAAAEGRAAVQAAQTIQQQLSAAAQEQAALVQAGAQREALLNQQLEIAGTSIASQAAQLEQRSRELAETVRLAGELKAACDANAAKADGLSAQLAEVEAARARLETLCQGQRERLEALGQRLAEIEERLGAERARARSLADQRARFITEVSRHLRS
jgi:SAM-dependent methyltransferase